MSRTHRGAKSPGQEFWTARPGNRGGAPTGRASKRRTARAERRRNRLRVRDPSDLA